MDAARAMSLVVERISSEGRDYPTEGLTAAPFEAGWCVYAPELIADGDEDHDSYEEFDDDEVTRSVFLVGRSGHIREITSSAPADEAREWFEEACVWFAAEESHHGQLDPSLPAHPDLSGSSRQRPAADYDREAIEVFARALTPERDFAGWLGDRLRE